MLPLVLPLLLAASPSLGPPEPEPAAGEARSVYRLGPLDAPLTVAALGIAVVPERFATRIIHRRCPCDAEDVNVLDRFAIGLHSKGAGYVSDGTVALSVLAPVVADAVLLGNTTAFREDLAVFVETLGINSALVMGVKLAVQRPLPVTYAGEGRLQQQAQGYRSFYSGHTSTAVAALTAAAWTAHLRYGTGAWPWVVTGLAGASVAVERVAAGRHFPSDVLVGAAAGFGVGTLVPLLHARGGLERLSVAPMGRGAQLVLAW